MIARGIDTNFLLEKDLLSITSEYNILNHYLDVITIPCVINSPLRADTNPSLGLQSVDGHKIFYKDFSTGDSGDTFKLLRLLWSCNYYEVLHKLTKDLPLLNSSNPIYSKSCHKNIFLKSINYPEKVDLQVKIRKWKSWDLEYWKSYGISKEWLEFGKVYPISKVFLSNYKGRYSFPADKYAYVYIENKDDNISIKIYQPHSNTHKWANNHNYSVWDLWRQLPDKGENLIITSSRKDALCIWSNTNIPSCSLQAESVLPKESVINILKERFSNIYILYDNDYTKEDNPGRRYGALLSSTFNLQQIEIPSSLESKDSSDLYHSKGKDVFIKTIYSLINH